MGKISKPQRSRKHKKLKPVDPFYIGNRAIQNRKNVKSYNREPVKDNEFEMGRHEIVKVKSVKKRQRTKRTGHAAQKSGLEQEGVPEFTRGAGESERAFMRRVDQETQAVIQQAHFNDKYQPREQTHTDEDSLSTTTRRDKRKLRLQKKKEKTADKKRQRREDEHGGFAHLRDEVKFGEVVLQPPNLSVKPRHATNSSQVKRSLLLTQLLPVDSSRGHRTRCMAERVMLDAERQRAIDLYRQMKASQT